MMAMKKQGSVDKENENGYKEQHSMFAGEVFL